MLSCFFMAGHERGEKIRLESTTGFMPVVHVRREAT
jgi:hypothetical protein